MKYEIYRYITFSVFITIYYLSAKRTEENIKNALSVVRNSLRQQGNVPDDIFFKLNDIEAFYEHSTIYKNNKQIKLTDYFF